MFSYQVLKSPLPVLVLCLSLGLAAAAGCGLLPGRNARQEPGAGQPGVNNSEQLPASGTAPAGAAWNRIQPYQILGDSYRLNGPERLSMKKWREQMVQVASRHPGEVFLNGPSDRKAVCLTFDDGPDGVFTPKVLDILKRYGVPGSFFFIGERVKSYPAVVRRVDREGNLVLNHTWNHADLSRLGDRGIGDEIARAGDAVAACIGKRPAIVRPPYGAVNDQVIRDLSQGNYRIVIWSIDTLDWSEKEKGNIVRNVMDNVRPGDIILMHSNGDRQATVEALPEIITGLQSRGYSFLTLSQMLGIPAYR
jgi:peptidoglycan/xylan/chitin deacetylase (PgdA/CDA1 family)